MNLFILISWGWTIKFIEIEDLNIYGPISLFTIFCASISFNFIASILIFKVVERSKIDSEDVWHPG